VAEAPKLVEESEEDSPDDAQLPGANLQRQASVSSSPISCGDSSEHEGPDSSKLLFQFPLLITFVLIYDSVSIFFISPQPIRPSQLNRRKGRIDHWKKKGIRLRFTRVAQSG
jgi:hypothetical protein